MSYYCYYDTFTFPDINGEPREACLVYYTNIVREEFYAKTAEGVRDGDEVRFEMGGFVLQAPIRTRWEALIDYEDGHQDIASDERSWQDLVMIKKYDRPLEIDIRKLARGVDFVREFGINEDEGSSLARRIMNRKVRLDKLPECIRLGIVERKATNSIGYYNVNNEYSLINGRLCIVGCNEGDIDIETRWITGDVVGGCCNETFGEEIDDPDISFNFRRDWRYHVYYIVYHMIMRNKIVPPTIVALIVSNMSENYVKKTNPSKTPRDLSLILQMDDGEIKCNNVDISRTLLNMCESCFDDTDKLSDKIDLMKIPITGYKIHDIDMLLTFHDRRLDLCTLSLDDLLQILRIADFLDYTHMNDLIVATRRALMKMSLEDLGRFLGRETLTYDSFMREICEHVYRNREIYSYLSDTDWGTYDDKKKRWI
jgi:hypothetical protein